MTEWIGLITAAAISAVMTATVVRFTRRIRRPRNPLILRLSPSFFFWLELVYLAVLLTLAVLYNRNDFGLQTAFEGGLIGDILPIGVPWFGAVGAVMVSLQGIFDFGTSWDRRYNYWHLARPLFGAVLGVMAFFMFALLIKSTGTELDFLADTAKPDDFIVYYVVAFLVGYREETFRELVKRVVDLIFRPGGLVSPAAPSLKFFAEGVEQTAVDFGEVPTGESSSQTLQVRNAGSADLTTPTLSLQNEPPEQTEFTTANDGLSGTTLAPGASATVDIVFAPTEPGDYVAVVEISSASLTAPASLEVTGKAIMPSATG